jgi:hypothetical protein
MRGLMKRKTGPIPQPLEARFMKHVLQNSESGCWLWTGHISKDGYGRFGMRNTTGVGYRWKALEAHQVSWIIFRGNPPTGIDADSKVIDHICNNRACVKPEHLQILGRIENVMKGRA